MLDSVLLFLAGQLLQAYTMVEKTRQAFKLEKRERKLKQIFVRGSNIVMISCSPRAKAAPESQMPAQE